MFQETLAVLAAVTEVIKSQGGKETETEYFAALMSTIEVNTLFRITFFGFTIVLFYYFCFTLIFNQIDF